jgi:predicted acetyltransferase
MDRGGAAGDVTVRSAREADLDRLIEIHRSAFPDARGVEARRLNFTASPLGSLDTLFLAERRGAIVAHAFLFPLDLCVAGARVKAGGIASVGVAPEARGTGVAAALLDALHATSHARGDALTYLYAFRQGFYFAHGYAPASPMHRIVATPRAIPPAWVADARRAGLRAATGDDAPGILATYERAADRSNGFLARPSALWERRFLDERRSWFVLGEGANVKGYIVWTLVQDEVHAATRMNVLEVIADDDAHRRTLLGLVGTQRDQVATFALHLDSSDPLGRALVDADAYRHGDAAVEHELGQIVGGPLVRVHDPIRALEARGWPKDGALVLEVGARRLRLQAKGGKATATATTERADVIVDEATFSALLFGGLTPVDASRMGILEPRDPEALARAQALLELPPFLTLDWF